MTFDYRTGAVDDMIARYNATFSKCVTEVRKLLQCACGVRTTPPHQVMRCLQQEQDPRHAALLDAANVFMGDGTYYVHMNLKDQYDYRDVSFVCSKKKKKKIEFA